MKFEVKVALIFVAGAALRLAFVALFIPGDSLAGDAREYLTLGIAWAQTGHYRRTPAFDRLPGAPLLAAIGFVFGGEAGARYGPSVLLIAANQVAIWVIWNSVTSQFTPRTRLTSLLVLQFCVSELLFPLKLLPDWPALYLALFAIALVGSARYAKSFVHQTGAGIALGLTYYFRPDYLAVVVAVPLGHVLWLLIQRDSTRRDLVAAAVTFVVAMSIILPWGARNHALTGRFFLLNQLGKMALYWGFNDARTLEVVKDVDARRGRYYLEEGENDPPGAERKAWTWIREHPLDSARLVVSRLVSHVRPSPPGFVIDYVDAYRSQSAATIHMVVTHVLHEFWLIAGIAALTLTWRRMPHFLFMFVVILVARTPVVAISPDQGRYWFALLPLLACFAIWFAGSRSSIDRKHVVRRLASVSCLLLLIQLWFVAAWGNTLYWYPVIQRMVG